VVALIRAAYPDERASCAQLTVAGEQALNRFAQAIAVLDEPIATEAQFTEPSR